MAFSNFLVTAAALGAAALMLGGDVRRATTTLRRNVNVLRGWLAEAEEAGAAAAAAEKMKEIEKGSGGRNARGTEDAQDDKVKDQETRER